MNSKITYKGIVLLFILSSLFFLGCEPPKTTTELPPTSTRLPPTSKSVENPTAMPTDTPEVAPPQTIDKYGVPMILIPAGSFSMGNGEGLHGPVHSVVLSDFYIDQFEVSNELFAEFLNENGNQEEGGGPWLDVTSRLARGHLHEVDCLWISDEGYEDHPVVEVTWYAAQAFCEWRGARLATEAEWEKAARGNDLRTYPWGEDIDCDYANYKACGLEETMPVESHPQGASPYGVFNMAGNASEWTADWFSPYPGEQVTNPRVTEVDSLYVRVVRGGSWYSRETYLAAYFRNTEFDPLSSFSNLGFRCAANPPTETGPGGEMASDNLLVPSGSAPIIDGTISGGEWDGAAVELFSDGSELLLLHADGDLYLGIRSNPPEMIATNVFVNRGDEITIMHSSAALGTAIYHRSEDGWEKAQDFNWRCRDSSNSDSAKAARAEFLQQEGWLANISYMGNPEEVEYRIVLSEDVLRVAVNFLRASNPSEKIPWPANLDDDCIKPTPGGYPEILSFSIDQWGMLEFLK